MQDILGACILLIACLASITSCLYGHVESEMVGLVIAYAIMVSELSRLIHFLLEMKYGSHKWDNKTTNSQIMFRPTACKLNNVLKMRNFKAFFFFRNVVSSQNSYYKLVCVLCPAFTRNQLDDEIFVRRWDKFQFSWKSDWILRLGFWTVWLWQPRYDNR
jgi:hypothetical protein